MSQRSGFTKWLWCLLAVYVGPGWSRAVSARTPPKNPSTIEAQAKFFQDFFSVQLSPYKIEFGHVCEDPNTWEQRYEKKDFKNHRDMGKVRWGDKKGGYGEHYWDLNHAGHAGNHGNDEYDNNSDDGSYNHDLDHAHDDHDSYDEPSDQLPTYGTDEYDPEQAAKYDESGRAKRAYPKIKTDRKLVREEESYEEPHKPLKNLRVKERLQTSVTQQEDKREDVEDNKEPAKRRRQRKPENVQEVEDQNDNQKEEQDQEQRPQYYRSRKENHKEVKTQDHRPKFNGNRKDNQKEEQNQEKTPKYYVTRKDNQKEEQNQELTPQYYGSRKDDEKEEQNQEQKPQYYVNSQENENKEPTQEQTPQYYQKDEQNQGQRQQYYTNRAEKQFVPYEQGAGVRQHHPSDITPAATVPRLFLEPTTGYVVDRATGQAYVLQPLAINNYN